MAPRVALLGYGAIADFHAGALRQAGAELRLVAGPNEPALASFGARHGIARLEASATAACSRDDVDVVVIASPSAAHAEQARVAIRNGKHVLVEIPLALSLADGEELVDLADRHGVLLGV